MHWLFDTSHFVTRSHCGFGWTETLRIIYISSNLSIGVAYFAIPVMLLALYRSKRQDLPSPWMLCLFASFILLCGTTHVTDVMVFWWAPYRLYTLLYALTAIASLGTAITLPRVIAKLVKLPSREYVHSLNNQLQALVLEREIELRERTDERDRLLRELDHAREVVVSQSWINSTNDVLDSLNAATAILTGK